jgi:hypothetical protein
LPSQFNYEVDIPNGFAGRRLTDRAMVGTSSLFCAYLLNSAGRGSYGGAVLELKGWIFARTGRCGRSRCIAAIDVQNTLAELAGQFVKQERDNLAVKLTNDVGPRLDLSDTPSTYYDRQPLYADIELKLNEAESAGGRKPINAKCETFAACQASGRFSHKDIEANPKLRHGTFIFSIRLAARPSNPGRRHLGRGVAELSRDHYR